MYVFNPPLTPEGVEAMMPRVVGLLMAERRRQGLPAVPDRDAGPPAGGYPPVAPASRLLPLADPPPRRTTASIVESGNWYLCEPVGDIPVGTEVTMPSSFNPDHVMKNENGQSALVDLYGSIVRVQRMAAEAVPEWAARRRSMLGGGPRASTGPSASTGAGRGGSTTPTGEDAFASGAGESGLAAFRSALAARRGSPDPVSVLQSGAGEGLSSSDARTLPILVDRTGERWRDFSGVVSKVQFSDIEGWPLEGPRTALWVIKFVSRHGGSFQGRHTKWVSENRLERSDPLVQDHDTISEVMGWLCCVDQLDVSNLVGAESLLRKYQLIEEIKTTREEPGTEEHAYFKGKMKTLHGACICPELTAWVADRVKSDNEILKQRSRATELRGLDPKGPPAKTK